MIEIKFSYIFRTKIINHYSGCVEFINNKSNLYQRVIRIANDKYLADSSLQNQHKIFRIRITY
jgi:hypothetical protein